MLEVYLVTMKQENYKVETEKYIAYEKRHRHWKSVPRLVE